MADIDKMRLGRFYTQTNPFMCDPFYQWILHVSGGDLNNITFIEPFAGANNIVELVNESLIVSEICDDESELTWECYDIDPASDEYNTSGYSIKKQDTLEDMPISAGEFVYITNPPYLAKNSATRSHIDVDFEDTDDLYKLSLKKMLNCSKNVCAIIPHSFLNQKRFFKNLYCVRILNCIMFDDTEHPVCLAFFMDDKTQFNLTDDDFYIFKDEQYIRYNSLLERYKDLFDMDCNLEIKMNAPEGEFGFRCIDNNIKNDIRMTKREEITSTIKHSSRSVTRFDISGVQIENKDKFIDEVNKFIESFRYETHDIFLTAFKGLKRDGNYRMCSEPNFLDSLLH